VKSLTSRVKVQVLMGSKTQVLTGSETKGDGRLV
jgi:hypothetical protein